MARTRVARFNIMITASAEQVRGVFDRLNAATKNWSNAFSASITSMAFAWNNVSQAIDPVVQKFREVAERAVEIGNASRRVGVSAEFFQILSRAGQRAGVDMDRIVDILDDFQERVGMFRRGETGITDAFTELGLTTQTLSTDMEVAFMQVADAIREVSDQAIQASLAEEIFADAGKQLLTVLQDQDAILRAARQADRAGDILTDEDIERIKEFQSSWADLSRTVEGFIQNVIIDLTPALTALVNFFDRAIDRIQRFNAQMRETDVITERVFRALFPVLDLFGTGRGGGAGAAASIERTRSEADRYAKRRTELLESVDRKLDESVRISPAGVS